MKNILIRLLALFAVTILVSGMLPTCVFASDRNVISVNEQTAAADKFWERAEGIESKLNIHSSDFMQKMYDEIARTEVKNLTWDDEDTFTFDLPCGVRCIYDYNTRLIEKSLNPVGDDSVTTYTAQSKGAGNAKDVFLVGPFYGYDSSFTEYYRNLAQTIASATGGSATVLSGTSATPAAIKARLAQKKDVVCLFDSHGISANGTSYLLVRSSDGITSQDFSNSWATSTSSGSYGIDARCMTNGQTTQLSNCFMWFATCEGMMKNGLSVPFVNCGAAGVYGYSKSVSFNGDYAYAKQFWGKMLEGYSVADSIAYMKQICGPTDSAGINAYPIVVSPEDPYPSNVNTNQTVHCSWTLFSNNVYYITYNANGGKNEPPKQKLETTEDSDTVTANLTLQVPYKFPYTFEGWGKENNGVADYQPGQQITVSENTTLYAAWFVSDSLGVNAQNNLNVRYANTYEYRKVKTQADSSYNFVNSNGNVKIALLASDGTELASGESFEYELKADTNYYISFTASTPQSFILTVTTDSISQYALSYSSEAADNVPNTQTGSFTYTVSDTIPTRFAYNFEGWSLSPIAEKADYLPGSTITLTQDTTLYAVWSEPKEINEETANLSFSAFYGADRYVLFRAKTNGKVTFAANAEIILYNVSGEVIGQGSSIELSAATGTAYYICVKAINDVNIKVVAEEGVISGDVNGDGKINTADATIVLKASADIISITEKQQIAADVNNNGMVNTADAVLILKYAAGIITEL